MKNLFFFLIFLLGTSLGIRAQEIPPRPSPPKLVNDLAHKLNPTEITALEQKLVAYNDSTSTQIAIVIIPSTEPYPIADYAFKLGREWQVGQKDKNNGIVLLWAPNDRKVFIATGYGMEGAIPDAIAKRIISTVIIPEFKNEMYYKGLDKGIDAIISYSKGEFQADPAASEDDFPLPFLIIVIVIIILIFITRNRRGGGGGGYRDSGPVFFPTSTFSGWGHSSGNWGGSSGGGFGGFGGGSFGGGGAGGDY